jgi:rubredoxin
MNTAKMNTATRMKCQICGHIYDPKKGERGIPVGTAFADLPEDWCCPVCKVSKTKFTEVK